MNKKYLQRIVVFTLILTLMVSYFPIDFADVTGQGFVYEIDDEDNVHITGYTGNATDLVIPATIDGKPVMVIENAAFKDKGIVYVTLPDGLREIGNNAFAGNLIGTTSGGAITATPGGITLPPSVKIVGDHAFFDNQLETIDLSHVEQVGTGAFSHNVLTSVNLAGVQSVGPYAFRDNQLETVDLATVKTVGADAFASNNLTTVNFSGVETIGNGAFKNNKLTAVDLPTTITAFGTGVFYYNGQYVRVRTDNNLITNDTAEGAFGHYVNVVTVTVEHIDKETGEKIIDDVVLGDDLDIADEIVQLGVETVYYPPQIAGYYIDGELTYTPDSYDYTLEAKYTPATGAVSLEVEPASVEINATVDEAFLRGLITVAMDAVGNDIKDLVTITPNSIDTSVAGEHSVVYQVTADRWRLGVGRLHL